MEYLITGGAGFIGTNLTQRLLKQGHRVTVLDNFSTTSSERPKFSDAKIIKGDVLDRDLVFSLASSCNYIIHLAAVVGVRLAMTKGKEGLRTSYLGTENVLESAYKNNIGVFVASSSACYGKITHSPVSEDDDILLGPSQKSSWLYSVAKLAEEHLTLAYFRESDLNVKIGRFFNVIGPYQTGAYGMVVPRFIDYALNDKTIPVYGNGQQTRTFCYIEDILDGMELVIKKGKSGEIYNIGGTEEITILKLADKIRQLTCSNSPIELIPYEKAFHKDFEETLQRIPDITKLQDLGYSPKYSLNEALKKIIEYRKSL